MLKKKLTLDNGVFFVPMGGCGEIGRNLNFFGYKTDTQEHWIIVDAGISIFRKFGVQVIYSGLGVMKDKKIDAIVCTHAHDDHIGAIPYIIQELGFHVPIYATQFTMRLLVEKLKEKSLLDKCNLINVNIYQPFNIGPFNLEFIYVTHSLPEPNMIKISVGGCVILDTGDWKFDQNPVIGPETDYNYLKKITKVDYLICDSTNALETQRTKSEGEAAVNLERHIQANKQRKIIVIACISSNTARVQSIINIAKKTNRKVVLLGASLERVSRIALEMGYLNDYGLLVEKESIQAIQENLLIICTGSQGEPSSGLDKLANKIHKYLTMRKGDMVIFSARIIPGNEVEVIRMKNQLVLMGVELLDTSMDSSIHVSGHPSQVEIEELISYIKPKNLIPIHGDQIRLQKMYHIAERNKINSIIPHNGIVIRLDGQKPYKVGEIEPDIIAVDGLYPVSTKDPLFAERSEISEHGVVIIYSKNNKIHFRTLGINNICYKSLHAFLDKNKANWEEIEKPVHFFFYKYYGKLPKIIKI